MFGILLRNLLVASAIGHELLSSSTQNAQGTTDAVSTEVRRQREMTTHFVPAANMSERELNELCDKTNKPLVYYIYTRLDEFDIRDKRRAEFASYSDLHHKVAVFFPLGRCKGDCPYQDKLDQEFATKKDIFRGDFVDEYSNLSLKYMSSLRFLRDTCKDRNHSQRYIVKLDGDNAWNLGAMQKWTESHEFNKNGEIIGALAEEVFVEHGYIHKNHEWELPHMKLFPTFVYGACEMFNTVAADVMLRNREKFPYFTRSDDIYAGLLTQNSSVTLHADARFHNHLLGECKPSEHVQASDLKSPLKNCDCSNWFCMNFVFMNQRDAMADFAVQCHKQKLDRANVAGNFQVQTHERWLSIVAKFFRTRVLHHY